MILSKEDAALFFRLMWSVQSFVGQKQGLVPEHVTPDAYERLKGKQKLEVREALFAHPDLIETYVRENPHHLSAEELAIVASWRRFVDGQFFIERYLARHAIFIQDESVYAVVGLTDPFDVIIPRQALPVYVQAVLLPFKGRIVYDGLLRSYSVSFGGGIRGELKETYLRAKQNRRIIESLEPGAL